MGWMVAKASVRNRISPRLLDLKALRPMTLERMEVCRRTRALPPGFQMVWNPNALRTLSRVRRLKRNRAAMGWMAAKASVRNRISPRLPDLKALRPMTPERKAACCRTGAIPPRLQVVRNPTAPSRDRRLRRNLPAVGRMAARASVRNRISPQLPDLKTLRPMTLERMAMRRWTEAIPPGFQMVWNPTVPTMP